MNRPRLFLSAVSVELRSARQAVAATVRTLGFDPVSQDDFPTGYGELREWLREQIDSCEGLIQLVGHGYGAEPPEVDPKYGRVSYTQLEFLYAGHQGKKTWVIVIGEDCHRDKPSDQLDLPCEAAHPDPAGYQAERKKLQQDYIARLTRENHLRHTANNDTELQNIVLRLRDELSELRRGAELRWRRLSIAVIAILFGLMILGGGGWLAYKKLFTTVQQAAVVDTVKIRAHLLRTAEETHRRELAEVDAVTDWKQRQRQREAADTAHTVRLSRIEELATSFAEIEGRGRATSVFQEMTRILTEQGVDEAIAYVATQRSSILQAVRARAAATSERNRNDLEPLLRAAALHQTKGQSAEARALYAEILAAEPDWPEALHAAFWFHVYQGDLARVRTTLADVRRNYEEGHQLAQRLNARDPTNTEWQRDLSISHGKLGDVAVVQGKLADAAAAYGGGLAIIKKLSSVDPTNTQWQRDLSIFYDRLGDVARGQGKLEDAATAYGDGLAIRKKLLSAQPTNTKWQHDLSVSYDQLGYVAKAQGKLEEAAQAYNDGLAIRKKLLSAQPTNTEWQRALSVSYERLGNVAEAQGKLEDAATAYADGLAIRKKLLSVDPTNTQWQRDLSVSYERLGNVAVAQGKLDDAATAYADGLAIMKNLTSGDPTNTQWQHDLWVYYWRLADLAEMQKKPNVARGYWKKAFDVLSGIEKRGLHLSPEDRQYLETLRRKAGAPTP